MQLERELRDIEKRNLNQTMNTTMNYALNHQVSTRSMSPFSQNGGRYPSDQNLYGYQHARNNTLNTTHQSRGSRSPLSLHNCAEMDTVAQLEQTQLRVAQKMVESTVRMECSFCYLRCPTQQFYQHLLEHHSGQINNAHFDSQMIPIANNNTTLINLNQTHLHV